MNDCFYRMCWPNECSLVEHYRLLLKKIEKSYKLFSIPLHRPQSMPTPPHRRQWTAPLPRPGAMDAAPTRTSSLLPLVLPRLWAKSFLRWTGQCKTDRKTTDRLWCLLERFTVSVWFVASWPVWRSVCQSPMCPLLTSPAVSQGPPAMLASRSLSRRPLMDQWREFWDTPRIL